MNLITRSDQEIMLETCLELAEKSQVQISNSARMSKEDKQALLHRMRLADSAALHSRMAELTAQDLRTLNEAMDRWSSNRPVRRSMDKSGVNRIAMLHSMLFAMAEQELFGQRSE